MQSWLCFALIWFRPRKILKAIAAEERRIWVFPLLVISAGLLVFTFTRGWVQSSTRPEVVFPPDYQYYLPDEQQNLQNALALANGPVFVYLFPAIAALAGLGLYWLVYSGLLVSGFRILRGRCSGRSIRNLTAWAMLPMILRFFIQSIYMVLSGEVIKTTGMSGVVFSSDALQQSIGAYFLSGVDIYLIWQMALLIIGGRYCAKISWWQSLPTVVVSTGMILMSVAVLNSGLSALGSILAA